MKIIPFEEGLVREGKGKVGKGEVRLPWALSVPWSGASSPKGTHLKNYTLLKETHSTQGYTLMIPDKCQSDAVKLCTYWLFFDISLGLAWEYTEKWCVPKSSI